MLRTVGTSKSGLGKASAKRLRPCVVFRRSNVDEHPVLFQSKNTTLQKARQNVLFQTGRAIGNRIDNVPIENVHASVD